jgi:NAD(P)-dependent dehydrogenase (short-subunit alcohol dehydrogenase family)
MTVVGDGMAGKLCLVTGATAGIGRVAAGALAAQGAQVIVCGRNPHKTRACAEQIRSESGNPAVEFLLADFSDLEHVRELAETFKARHTRLDVLLNNAGGFFNRQVITAYGVEMMFLVNHLAPFLLTNLLLEVLKGSAPARIVNVSSDAHHYGKLDLEDLGFKHGFFGMKGYGRSKLANILFTYELARRLEGTGVTVNALHPGHVATDIWKTNFSIFGPALKRVMSWFSLTPAQGADTLIFLATSPQVAGVTGRYFIRREAVTSSAASYDEDLARRLWQVSAGIVSLDPGMD